MTRADSLSALWRSIAHQWAPPPNWTLSQWADKRRKLSSEASAEPGQWDTSRAEFQRGILDAVTDPLTHTVVLKKSAQVGATEILLNTIGYFIDFDASPILCLQPTLELAEAFSKDRLAPMLRDTPALRGRVGDPKSRDSGSTMLHRVFPGGHVTLAGANSPASLASRPIRVVLFDEVDRYPRSAGEEGDPIALATKRTATFWNRKRLMVSTPTNKGFSRIDDAFNEGDMRIFEIPCPRCGTSHALAWSNVVFKSEDPASARFRCPCCAKEYSNAEKNAAVRLGEWRATAEFKGTASFHINELYSPWRTVAEIVEDFLAAKDYPDRLRVWVNTTLGETWAEGDFTLDGAGLAKRVEKYPAEVPGRVLLLTYGGDVQIDRIEAEMIGWGAGEESWSIEAATFWGNPDLPEGVPGSPWDAFTAWRRRARKHETAGQMMPWGGCIDTGGSSTEAVYSYCRGRRGERLFAVKGVSGEDKPIVGAAQRRRVGKVRRPVDLFLVAVDQAKSILYRRLRIESPGQPGYCHFPAGRSLEWFEQLVAEKLVTERDRKGFKKRTWHLEQGKRNEALDCRVYGYAAMMLAKPDWQALGLALKKKIGERKKRGTPEPEEKPLTREEMLELLKPAGKVEDPTPTPAPTPAPVQAPEVDEFAPDPEPEAPTVDTTDDNADAATDDAAPAPAGPSRATERRHAKAAQDPASPADHTARRPQLRRPRRGGFVNRW